MMPADRDAISTDALLTDLYLDALLAGAVLDAAGVRSPDSAEAVASAGLDPAARRAADRLRHDLVRVHPSFRFEERLATRLAEAAIAMRVPLAAGEGRVVPFRTASSAEADPAAIDAAHDDVQDLLGDPPHGVIRRGGRPLLIGGALTSAALSIAGAAFVAWRFGRPGRASTPMARAARAVRDARLAATVGDVVAATGRLDPRRLD